MDTAHVVANDATNRESLYVAAMRGFAVSGHEFLSLRADRVT